MDKQKFFDDVATHLLTQGRKSLDPIIYQCRYRFFIPEENVTLSCAIGIVIPDEIYSVDMEGHEAMFVFEMTPDLRAHWKDTYGFGPDVSAGERRFVSMMQSLHDCYPPKDWARKFAAMAKLYHLTMPEVG